MTTSAPHDGPVAPGTRLLAIARLWFSPPIVSSVFEPLVADWQAEAARTAGLAGSRLVNLRWRLAFVANGLRCIPRSLRLRAPGPLLLDVAARAVVFGTLGFILQQIFGRPGEIAGTAVLDSLPFALLPVVLRIQRSTELPEYAARTLVLLLAMAVALVLAIFGGSVWQTRSTASAIPVIIALFGWRLGMNQRRWTEYSPLVRWGLSVAMLANTWSLATYPVNNALGVPAGRALLTEVHLLLAVLLAALLHVDDRRELRRTNERRV